MKFCESKKNGGGWIDLRILFMKIFLRKIFQKFYSSHTITLTQIRTLRVLIICKGVNVSINKGEKRSLIVLRDFSR